MNCVIKDCASAARKRGMCNLHYLRVWKHGDPQAVSVRSCNRPVRDRLYANTVITPTGCIERSGGGGHEFGYTLINIDGVTRSAHRVSYELEYGPIPEDMFVLHRCDNPPCIAPLHLFLGTQLDNMRDRHAKGRTFVNPRSA